MPLQGDLREFGVPEVFQILERQEKSGRLRIDAEAEKIEIYFEEGRIVGAFLAGRNPSDSLLEVLCKLGHLSEERAGEFRKMRAEDLRSLPALLERELILPAGEIDRILRQHTEEMLFPIFQLKRGSFFFEAGEALAEDLQITPPLPVEPILLEGLRKADEWPMLKKRIGPFQQVPQRQLALGARLGGGWIRSFRALRKRMRADAGDSEEEWADRDSLLEEEPSLTETERLVYGLIDGKRSIEAIVSASGIGEFSACQALLALRDRGWIRTAPKDRPVPTPRKPGRPLARARREWLGTGVVLGGLLALFLFSQIVTEGGYRPWWREVPFLQGSGPVQRVLNHQQRERVRQALAVYRLENGAYPSELVGLVDARLLRERDLSLWGPNRFSYQPAPEDTYRLLIVPF